VRRLALFFILLIPQASFAQIDYEAAATSVAADARACYEHLHEFPELGKAETATSAYIRDRLTALGYTTFYTIAALPTAVVTTFDTGLPGPTICLRAEIDARPQQEATGLPYASQTPGVMHSCGHDAHTAILLGIAQLLPSLKASLHGKIVLLFQPAEETAGGADDVVASGLLTTLGVTAIFAQHSAPGLPVGEIQLSPGPILAGSNYFTITVSGKESHAAAPFEGNDITACAATLASELPTFFTRKVDMLAHPSLLSVTYINAGSDRASNIVPGEATIKGTLRSFEDIDTSVAGAATMRTLVEGYVTSTAGRCGATSTIVLRKASPPTANDATLYRALAPHLQAAWPTPVTAQQRGMFSEDFAYYTNTIPSLYLSLGIQKGTLGTDSVHTTTFTVHPDALREGIKALLILADYATR
jgi:amidohydrolase